MEVLVDAVAADADGAVGDDGVPEEAGGPVHGLVAGEVGYALEADDLGYLRVGVHAGEAVLSGQEGVEQGAVRESPGQFEIFGLAGDGGDVGKDLVESAVLAHQHLLHLIVGQPRGQPGHPVGEGHEHVAGLGASGLQPSVAQSGIGLVDVVEGYPAAVEVESAGTDVAAAHLGPYPASVGGAAQIAVARGVLTPAQLGQHVVEAALDLGIARGGIHVREGRQVVSADVSVEAGILPVGIVGGLGGEPGLLEIWRQQAVGVEPEQIAHVHLHGVAEGRLGEPHGADGIILDVAVSAGSRREAARRGQDRGYEDVTRFHVVR